MSPTAAADAGIDRRDDIRIPAGNDYMAGWLYTNPKYTPSNPGPAIVLAHGLGGTKELQLDVYADKFYQLGYNCLVFDYRCSGASTGSPRGLISWPMQQEDWHTAIAYIRKLKFVDAERIGIFGTSFGGGHVIQVAAQDKRVKAVISQCPFTDGWQSSLCTGISVLPRLAYQGILDFLFGTDKSVYGVHLVGHPGEVALMNAPDVMEGFFPLIPVSMHEYYFKNLTVPARLIPTFPFLYPGSYAKHVECPILFAVCGKDSVAPAPATLAYARQAPKGVVKLYEDMGHFDIYLGEKHERAWREYASFIQESLPVKD